MLQKGICVWIFAMTLTAVVWSDESPGVPGKKQQRVSPKLLREALALPEYKAQVPAPATPPSLDRLKRLSEKLKSSGDLESAELLQHFIREYERLANQSPLNAKSGEVRLPTTLKTFKSTSKIASHVEFVVVNVDDLPEKSILRTQIADLANKPILDAEATTAFSKQLDRAVDSKHAKRLNESISVSASCNEMGQFHIGQEFPLPPTDGDTTIEDREFGLIVELQGTSIAKDQIRLQLTVEVRSKDQANAISLDGNTIPGLTVRKVQSTIDVKSTETFVVSFPSDTHGRTLFVMTKVTPDK